MRRLLFLALLLIPIYCNADWTEEGTSSGTWTTESGSNFDYSEEGASTGTVTTTGGDTFTVSEELGSTIITNIGHDTLTSTGTLSHAQLEIKLSNISVSTTTLQTNIDNIPNSTNTWTATQNFDDIIVATGTFNVIITTSIVFSDGTIQVSSPTTADLSNYAQLSDSPAWTGSHTHNQNSTINKADPSIFLTDTGDSNSATITRTDTSAKLSLKNTVYVPGFTSALYCDGTNDRVEFPDSSQYTFASSFTVTCWYKPDTINKSEYMVSQYDAGSGDGWGLGKQATSGGRWYWAVWANSTVKVVTGDSLPSAGWHFVAGRRDENGLINLFADGVKQSGSNTVAGEINSSENLHVGIFPDLNFDVLGTIDEVMVYNRDLSDAEILALYNSGLGTYGTGTETGLVLGAHFDERFGGFADTGLLTDPVYDYSVYKNTGALIGNFDWVSGLVTSPGTDTDLEFLSAKDGTGAAEYGRYELGHSSGTVILNGKEIVFNRNDTEVASIDSDGLTVHEDIVANDIVAETVSGLALYGDTAGTKGLEIDSSGNGVFTNYITVTSSVNANRVFVDNIYHVVGGTINANVTIDIASANVWYKVTNATENLWQGTEVDGFSLVTDSMIITNGGDYVGSINFSFSGTNSQEYAFQIYNVTQGQGALFPVSVTGQTAGVNLSYSRIIYIEANAGDRLILQVQNETGTGNCTIHDAEFAIWYLHD